MIELKNVTKSFDGRVILENINLTIPKGERTVIIGGSGCGKSTLLRLIIGLLEPDSGQILIDGNDITVMSDSELKDVRTQFGFLFQSGALFDSLSVADNIGFMLKETLNLPDDVIQKKVSETLSLVEMDGFGAYAPSDLSGGQRKRIGLARAIAARPSIVMYDEPTTGLDPILSTNIEDLIVKLSEQLQITSVIVTHQISTILRTADRIYMLDQKRLLPPETPDSIHQSANDTVRAFIHGGLE